MVNPPERPQGLVITFYSYKGGVGRTMALANVAALLAQRGKRVLVVDWDLEAPGIEKYFTAYLSSERARDSAPGIVDLILAWAQRSPIPWQESLLHTRLPSSHGEIHLLTAGRSTPDYVQRMRMLQFERLFEHHELGRYLEQLREEWRECYEFVLIDSRTGITDIGGICTVHLPDVLVALFTTNAQSLEGTQFVLSHARKAHGSLPVDRRLLLTVPVLARDETENLPDEAKVWHEKAASTLGTFYEDWLPREVPPVKAVELLKLPYVPAWSLGERLPVLEQGTANPRYLGFAYELLTRLLASGVDWQEVLTGTLQANSTEIRARLAEEERAKAEEALRATRIQAEEALQALRLKVEQEQAQRLAEQQRREAEQKAEQQRREAEQQAEQQRLKARQTRNRMLGLAGLLALGLILGAGFSFRDNASRKRALTVMGAAFGAADPLDRVLLVAEVAKDLKPEDFSFLQTNRTEYLPEFVLEDHVEESMNTMVTPDGRYILAIGGKGMRRWDARTGLLLGTHQAEPQTFGSNARMSPDGTRLLTYGPEAATQLWSVSTGQALARLEGPSANVTSARFSPDGRYILTVSSVLTMGTARIWEAASGKLLASLRGHSGKVISASFSPEGSRILTVDFDKTAYIWEAASGQLLASLQGHSEGVQSASFSPDGSRVLTASFDKTARLWEASSGKPLATLEGHSEAVDSASFSPDGSRILTVDFDGTARLWEASTGKPQATLPGHSTMVASAKFSPDGGHILMISIDGTARLWDSVSARLIATFSEAASGSTGAGFSPDGRYVLTGGKEGAARLCDASSGQLVAALKGRSPVTKAVFSPDSKWLLTIDEEGMGRVWSLPPTAIQWSEPQKAILEAASRACLAPALRIKYLEEEPADADARFKACEARRAKVAPGAGSSQSVSPEPGH